MARINNLSLLCAALALWASGVLAQAVTPIEEQRELFKRVYAAVERGNWSAVDNLAPDQQQALESYVLYPDLQAAWFRATLSQPDYARINEFLDQHGVLKPARELRYRYALHLAEVGKLGEYLSVYEQFYQGLNVPKLDCLALQAELEAGRTARVVNRAIALWTVGESQVDECDPVFQFLSDENLLGTALYMKRFELAIDAREFIIAQWLGKSIDQRHIDIAAQWDRRTA